MDTIYKYPVTPMMTLHLPRTAIPLTVQVQHGEPQLWVRLDPDAETVERTFLCLGMGDDVPAHAGPWIGTFQLEGGLLVYHVFEAHDGHY
jgi:hypothetical protein